MSPIAARTAGVSTVGAGIVSTCMTPSGAIAERGSAVESGTGLVNVSNESDVSPLVQSEKGYCTDESPHPAESPRHAAGRRLRSGVMMA